MGMINAERTSVVSNNWDSNLLIFDYNYPPNTATSIVLQEVAITRRETHLEIFAEGEIVFSMRLDHITNLQGSDDATKFQYFLDNFTKEQEDPDMLNRTSTVSLDSVRNIITFDYSYPIGSSTEVLYSQVAIAKVGELLEIYGAGKLVFSMELAKITNLVGADDSAKFKDFVDNYIPI